MKDKKDLFDYIQNERQAMMVIVFITFFVWQSVPALLGIMVYLVFIKLVKLHGYQVLGVGVFIVIAIMLRNIHNYNDISVVISQGFSDNFYFWKTLFREGFSDALSYVWQEERSYILFSPIFIGGLFGLIDLIPSTPHEKELVAINEAQAIRNKELNADKTKKALDKIQDENYNGTVLGVSKYSGNPIMLPDRFVNQVVLVLGTTGGGKTVTLRRFYKRAAMKGYPLIIVDGKPTDESVNIVSNLAKQYNRKFYGFNCDDCWHYDALAMGSYTELKDKIITLKDNWENDYYLSVAEDYLQGVLEVLETRKKRDGVAYGLSTVIDCLVLDKLQLVLTEIRDKALSDKISRLEKYNSKDITGLQAHLNTFVHSEIGGYFEINDHTFSLPQAIEENAIVYFALPALKYPSYAKSLGKLVVNDIKAIVERNTDKKIFTCFDEFSVFAGEQVLNLVNMGRSKGVHAVFGTQGLADLKRVDKNFSSQILNCANTIICHRLNDQDSAEDIAFWTGTKDTFNLTAQVDSIKGGTGMGSVRRVKEFIVHPDEIKQTLPVGEAFLITKVDGFKMDKIKIKSRYFD